MLKRVIALTFVIVFSISIVGCESESDKQTKIEQQKKEMTQKALKGLDEFKPSEKKSW